MLGDFSRTMRLMRLHQLTVGAFEHTAALIKRTTPGTDDMGSKGPRGTIGKTSQHGYEEPKGTPAQEKFKRMASMVVRGYTTTVYRDGKRIDRNAPCPCGSGNKFKKCHGLSDTAQRSRLRAAAPRVDEAAIVAVGESLTGPTVSGSETILAMLNSGLRKELVYAFKTTGLFITTMNRTVHASEDVAKWDAAIAEWIAMPMKQRNEILAEYGHQIKEEADADDSTPDEPARATSGGDDGGLRAGGAVPPDHVELEGSAPPQPLEAGGDAGVSGCGGGGPSGESGQDA